MKKLFPTLLILVILMASFGAGSAQAGAYETSFVTSITYQNIGTGLAQNVAILFYQSPSDTAPISIARPDLAMGAGTSVYIGSIGGLPTNLQGTAVMVSSQPLAATLVQVPSSATIKARPLSNGFTAGSPRSLLATYLKDPTINSILSVQNAGGSSTDVTIKFYAVGAASPTHQVTQTLAQGAGFYVDAGTVSQLGTTFSGSVVIDTTGGTGSIVSSAMELDAGSGTGAKAFEGVGQGSPKFYMPSALCVTGGPTTYYAVQNTDTVATAHVTVTYSPGGAHQSADILPGNKASFNTCAASGMATGFGGSAVVESSPAVNIIAIGKVTGGGLATAFNGVAGGATKVALPYVRYASDSGWLGGTLQRTFIAIQNVGTAINPGENITVKYINPDGSVAGTHTWTTGLAQYAKFSSNAKLAGLSEFGYTGGISGGSVVVEAPAGKQLAVVGRVQSYVSGTNQPGEDYNGIPFP
jgi:hypothetical protein